MACSSNQRLFLLLCLLFSTPTLILLLTATLTSTLTQRHDPRRLQSTDDQLQQPPEWLSFIHEKAKRRRLKAGLVNIGDTNTVSENNSELRGFSETVSVQFDRVREDVKWEDFFPEWIDEYGTWVEPSCPEMPMPAGLKAGGYDDLDVVVARVPCGGGGGGGRGVRDAFILQVNLVVANLAVRSGWKNREVDRTVFVVFVGGCEPMRELFRCDDLMKHEGDYWVYRPDLKRLKQKVVLPVGSCQLAPPYARPGKEIWRTFPSQSTLARHNGILYQKPKEAYATILHSSEAYVCGAIALAQSIIQTNSTRDLVLLVDDSISAKSLQGLGAAGWIIKHIQRIRNPHAKKGTYNEWNYSKLRLWQLTEYEKVIFLDADFIVLESIDFFFFFPQVSAAGNDGTRFNTGIMVIEPSQCMFETLMGMRHTLVSYNGGDQGFLNEAFTWWHRWPSSLNRLKIFLHPNNTRHDIPKDLFAIHYLGLKPWMCYKDYDCNWDIVSHHAFASDMAHQRWWQVYDAMPKKLQKFCALTKRMDKRLRVWRQGAQNARLSNGRWRIKVKDPRHAVSYS